MCGFHAHGNARNIKLVGKHANTVEIIIANGIGRVGAMQSNNASRSVVVVHLAALSNIRHGISPTPRESMIGKPTKARKPVLFIGRRLASVEKIIVVGGSRPRSRIMPRMANSTHRTIIPSLMAPSIGQMCSCNQGITQIIRTPRSKVIGLCVCSIHQPEQTLRGGYGFFSSIFLCASDVGSIRQSGRQKRQRVVF